MRTGQERSRRLQLGELNFGIEGRRALDQRGDGLFRMLQRIAVRPQARTDESRDHLGLRGDRVGVRRDAVAHRVDAEVRVHEILDLTVRRGVQAEIRVVAESGDRLRALGEEGLVSRPAVGGDDPQRRALDAVLRKQRVEHGGGGVALQRRHRLADEVCRLGDIRVFPADQRVRADLVKLRHRLDRHALRHAQHERGRIDDGEGVLLARDQLQGGGHAFAFQDFDVEPTFLVEALVDAQQIRRAMAIVGEGQPQRGFGQILRSGGHGRCGA